MRGKGVNYDTGFLPGHHDSRPVFDQAVVAAEMRIIARELGCTAVRVSGSKPERISVPGFLPGANPYDRIARLGNPLNRHGSGGGAQRPLLISDLSLSNRIFWAATMHRVASAS